MRFSAVVILLSVLLLSACSHGSRDGTIPAVTPGGRKPAGSGTGAFPSMTNASTPLPGTGSGGAFGPEVVPSLASLSPIVLPSGLAQIPEHDTIDLSAPLEFAPRIIESSTAEYTFAGTSIVPASPGPSASPAAQSASRSMQALRRAMSILPNQTFITAGDQDLGAATNGSYILQTRASGTFSIYSMSGSVVQTLAYTQIYCGANPLPICSSNYNPGPGDNRVIYDAGSQRWVMSSLWVNAGGPPTVPQASLAVSETSNPTGAWYIYQFPNCGTTDQTIGDQPRLGFNSQWIVVTSSCSLASDPSLNVFDKNNLYSGRSLTLNTNWFGFADSSNTTNKDNPARTYTATINNREYLSFLRDDANTSKEQVVYSHIEGSIDSPVFYSETDAVDTNVPWANGGGVSTVDGPGCTACVGGETNGTIQSSDVFQLSNGQQYILSTNVESDATYSNADDVISVATADSGAAETLAILPSESGQGAIASEIGMPSVQSVADTASIVYDYGSSTFYPGAYAAQWNLDYNRLDYNQAMQQGNIVPPGCNPPSNCTVTRIADYIDAIAPIPGSSQFIAGSDVLNSSATNDREIYWMNLSIIANLYPCDQVGGTCNFQVSWPPNGSPSCVYGEGIQDGYTGSGEFVVSPTGYGTLTQNDSAGTAQFTRTTSGVVTVTAQAQYESFTYGSHGGCVSHFSYVPIQQWNV